MLAWVGWNFLLCYAKVGSHPKGAAVSVTQENLKNGLWTELAHWRNQSPLLKEMFTWTQTKIYCNEHPETWYLSARSFPKSADMETIGATLSGIHAEFVLFLIDESGDIPPQIAKAAEQAMGECLARNGFCKIIQAGNPISRDGMLYHSSVSENWYNIRITGDPDDPERSPRIDKEWAREQINMYGKDDPWVMSYVLGLFPESSILSLLSVDEVERAMNKHLTLNEYSYSQKRLGVDVARSGMDSTVIFPRQGLAAFKYVEMRNADGPQVSAKVLAIKSEWRSEREYVDNTGGFGASAVDSLIMSGHTPYPIHFSEKATDPRYYNKRAEMWWEMALWIKRGGALPECQKLKKELTSVQYTTKKGRLILEDKEQLNKRLGYSPDRADALALTFAEKDMPATSEYDWLKALGDNRMTSDYDPMRDM